MDSNRIAEYLEEKYPSPSIHLDTPYKKKVLDQMIPIMAAVRVVFLPIMSVRVLSPGSVDYWNETRPKAFGKPFSEITEEERGDKAWAKAEEPIKEITRLLKENPDGPFFDGKTVTYADFYWAAYLLFWQKIGDDKFQKLLGVSGEAGKSDNVHLQLLEAVKPWSDRRDH